jgi:hypothetical protein
MAPDALGHLEAWFVCGSQHMYGAEQLRVVEAHAAGAEVRTGDAGRGLHHEYVSPENGNHGGSPAK